MKALLTATLMTAALALAGCSSFPTSLAQVETSVPGERKLEIESWQTPEGAKVLFVASPSLPMLDVRLVFDAGSARDGDRPGLASLTSALLGEGTPDRDVGDIARGFEDLGARFSSASYRDMAVVELRTLTATEFFEPATDLFIEVASQPSFPVAALDRIREQALIGLQQQQQVPGPQVSKAFYQALFGDHPYAHPSSGTEESLPAIRRADLQAFFGQYYAAGNAVIAMTGDLDRASAETLAARISAALPQGGAAPVLARAGKTLPQQQHLEFPSSQTILMLGQQSIWRGHPDWVPLYVGNQILGGGGFASILTEEVREKRGFVYGIGSGISPMAAAGPFSVQFQTANENADEALAVTLGLLRDFIANGPDVKQLEDARESLIGNFALTAAENDEIVGHLGAIGFYDLPLDYLDQFEQQVRTVTAEQVRDALQRNLDADALAIVSIGPKAPALPDTAGAE